MNTFVSLCTAAVLCAPMSLAAPLCDAFASADAMPKKYRKLAPVLSAGPADWILTQDQMDKHYALSVEKSELLSLIAAEFAARDTQMAVMMAPPRPIVAGQDTLNALSGGAADFDVGAVSQSFDQMIEDMRAAGIIAPNLLHVALRDDEMRDAYYYRHDTHWTPLGAAESAYALAEAVVSGAVAGFEGIAPTRPMFEANADVHSERGSLADMARAVCAAEIAPVLSPIPSFGATGLSLLGNSEDRPSVILAGSSFSDRYKRDAYRFADGIAGALKADVANHSVSGGGAIGAIEGVVNAGLLDKDTTPSLVIWELPYTEAKGNLGALRQLLGALQARRTGEVLATAELTGSKEVKLKVKGRNAGLLKIYLPGASLQWVKVDLRFEDGSKSTSKMVRRSHIPGAFQSDQWHFSLSALQGRVLKSVGIRYDSGKLGTTAKASMLASPVAN
ncbi:MAG: hypothetical protein MK098_07345 [Marinovum sp.]|nr:hypothetical protein [Marinovum sp.]